MELFVLCFPVLLLLLVFPLLYSLYLKSKPVNGGTKLPPGKTGWPIIGETLELFKNGRKGHPEKFTTDRMQKFSSKVFKTSLLGKPTAVFCGLAGNKFLFTNENKLVVSQIPRSIFRLFSSSDPNLMSRFVQGFLKPEALQRYAGIMDIVARTHFETHWDNKEEVMVYPLAKKYTFSLISRVLFCIDDPIKNDKLADAFHIFLSGVFCVPIYLPGTRFYRAIKASKLFRKELCEIVKQRRIDLAEKEASPMQDLLSHLLTSSEMDELSITDTLLATLVAGHTSSIVITFVMKYLAEFPHIYDQVLQEQMKIEKSKRPGEMLNWNDIQKMKYSWNVACEAMRLAPPGSLGGSREAICDFTYEGFFIPKGWMLTWSPYSTRMNPNYFSNPEIFNPARFEGNGPTPYTFAPFGGGPKMCPGMEFARLEILVFMHHVVRKYKWEKSLPYEKIIVELFPIPTEGLPIKLHPHNMY